MSDERGLPTTIIVPDEPGAERMVHDKVLLLAPFNVPAQRNADELGALVPTAVASTRDLCRVFDVPVEGTIRTETGEEVRISFAAEDENSFSLDGFVRGDDTMNHLYVKSRLADWLAARSIQSLTDAEVAELARRQEFLEKSLETEEK